MRQLHQQWFWICYNIWPRVIFNLGVICVFIDICLIELKYLAYVQSKLIIKTKIRITVHKEYPQMFLFLSVIFLIAVFLTVKFYYFPLQEIARLKKQFQDKGYKVKTLKFQFLNFSFGQLIRKNNFHLQFLNDFTSYDVVIGNVLSRVSIIPVSLDLVRDCFLKTKQITKSDFDVEVYAYFNDGGIVMAEGERYKKKKKIISSSFHYDFIMSLIPDINTKVKQNLELLENKIKQGKPIKSRVFFGQILADIISNFFLGVSLGNKMIDGKTLTQFIQNFTDSLNNYVYSSEHIIFGKKGLDYNISPQAKKLRSDYMLMKGFIEKVIGQKVKQYKEKGSKSSNLLYCMVNGNEQNSESIDNSYSFEQIIGEFFVFFIAAIDSTSAMLTVLMFVLSKNPQILQKLRKQCDQVDQRNLTAETLKKMEYMDGFINEGLRMYGPGAMNFIREVKGENFTIGNGVSVPPKTYTE